MWSSFVCHSQCQVFLNCLSLNQSSSLQLDWPVDPKGIRPPVSTPLQRRDPRCLRLYLFKNKDDSDLNSVTDTELLGQPTWVQVQVDVGPATTWPSRTDRARAAGIFSSLADGMQKWHTLCSGFPSLIPLRLTGRVPHQGTYGRACFLGVWGTREGGSRD